MSSCHELFVVELNSVNRAVIGSCQFIYITWLLLVSDVTYCE